MKRREKAAGMVNHGPYLNKRPNMTNRSVIEGSLFAWVIMNAIQFPAKEWIMKAAT
jgi:hypothetical protein